MLINTAALLLPLIAFFQQPAQPESPKIDAQLLLSTTALQPGSTAELAIQLKITDGWHIYHPLLLDTGAPTTISFEAPEGITFGELRFPEPSAGEEAGLRYLALEGEVVILTEVTAAEDIVADPISIKANIFTLACKKLCIPVDVSATLDIPITTDELQPANEKLFEEARALIPVPLTRAQYLRGSSVRLATDTFAPGQENEVIVTVNVQRGYHIQDRDPGNENLIPTRLFIEPLDGLKFDEQKWPKAHVREMPYFGKVREQNGKFEIRVPFRINDDKLASGPAALRVLLSYQCCSDAGTCFPPITAREVIRLTLDTPNPEAKHTPQGTLFPRVYEPGAAPSTPEWQGSAATETDESSTSASDPGATPAAATSSESEEWPLPMVFLFAFLGGVILNVMPCVLPVISLKIFGFVQQAGDDRARILRMGLVYAAGIMASFLVIAIAMVSAGLAWGGLMQRPEFLIGLGAVVFAFSLSLLGVFEIQLPGAAANAAAGASRKEGYTGAFMNGVMATLLATPCVGPFLGSAIGVLSKLPPFVAGTGIMVVGLGLAFPYVLLTAFPGWLRFMPKPGNWMVIFKQVVGFILVIVVVWLLSVLITQVETELFLGTLGLLTAVGMGCWLLGQIKLTMSFARTALLWALALLITGGGGYASFRVFEQQTTIPWQEWKPGIAQRLSEEGFNVYVDYTASWCLTCQSNKTLVLETDRIASEFEHLGIYPIKGDFTKLNPDMQRELQSHGRNGVPLNIIVPAGRPDEVIVLPEVLTQRIVLEALSELQPTAVIPEFWTLAPEEPAS